MTESLDGSVLFNDQGTELELLGVSLDEAPNMDLTLFAVIETGDDLGAISRNGSGTWSCTASYKKGAIAIRYVTELRRWHMKQSRVRREGYHIWGRIAADKWLIKG